MQVLQEKLKKEAEIILKGLDFAKLHILPNFLPQLASISILGLLTLSMRFDLCNIYAVKNFYELSCSDPFVLCRHRNDISMHSLLSGNWIKDLELAKRPNPKDHWGHSTEVVGSKDLMAAVLWERIFFFWEVKGEDMK